VERSLGLAFTTLTIFAPLAQAAHPEPAIKPERTASPLEFIAATDRNNTAGSGTTGGCTAAGGGAGGAMALAFFGLFRRRRRR